jgi:hypothetical protein
MVRYTSLFSQLLSVFSRQDFQRAVRDHGAERYAKGFTCWQQFVSMMFCQLAQAHSLREICGGLSCCLGKLVHLGISDAPKRSTLAYANAHRPWQLYQTVFDHLLDRCRSLTPGRRKFRFKNKLYSLDATVIDLSLSMFDWAKFRQTKGAVKLHLLLDHAGYLPTYAVITEGAVHEVHVARQLELAPGSILVIDRGFNDFTLFAKWCDQGVYFVTREKANTQYQVVEEREVRNDQGMLCDQLIQFIGPNVRKVCPNVLRRISYEDPHTGKVLTFLTNHLKFAPTTITQIYKDRWQIEIFFKALKNLKIKTFVGTSSNALHIQIWTALITILLLKYLQLRSRLNWALSNLVAFLRWNLFTYRNLWTWIDDPFDTPPLIPGPEHLTLALGQQNR